MEDVAKLMEPEYEAVNGGTMLRRKNPALFDRASVTERIEGLENEIIAFREILKKMDELGVK